MMNVAGRSYGPYTLEQMRAFAAEGRLVPRSLVASGDDEGFRAAAEDPDLAVLFQPAQPAAHAPAPALQFFTAEGDADAQSFARADTKTSENAHFVIVADMKSRSISGLEEEIFNLGPAFSIMPQAWLLQSDQPLNAVRNALVQKLGKLDVLFVIDATHDKAAWFNFGPESDSRLRRVWQRVQSTAPIKRLAG
jgi:hypothetical protein